MFWLTIEGVPEKTEVQIWLSAFGLPEEQLNEFNQTWGSRLETIFA